MKNFKGTIIIIPRDSDEKTIKEIGNHIHNQLIGNEDYINSNIGINLDEDQVLLWIDDCKGDIPDIIF